MSRLLWWLAIVTVTLLAVIGIVGYAIDRAWGPEATDRTLEESARVHVDGLAAALDSSMTDQQIIAAARRHRT